MISADIKYVGSSGSSAIETVTFWSDKLLAESTALTPTIYVLFESLSVGDS